MSRKQRRETNSWRRRSAALTLILLIVIVLANLILPMLTLLKGAFDFSPVWQGFVDVLTGPSTLEAIRNSVVVTLCASLLSVAMAFFFAYVVELKLPAKRRPLFRFLAILPMLVPSITHGLVIVYLFGKMGIVTRLIGTQLPIYGPFGIILGSLFYAFPLAFLVLSQALINLDGRLFESAAILGVQPVRRFFDITLPVMKYAIFSAFSVTFTMIFTDYGIPLSVGGTYPILPLLFYKNVIGLLDFGKGAIYSTFILIPAVGVYLLDVLYFSKKQVASSRNPVPVNSGRYHPLQRIGFWLVLTVLLVPIALIVITPFIRAWPYDMTITFEHFERIITVGRLGNLIKNSVLIAFFTGLAGTVLSLAAGYMYIRSANAPAGLKKVTHALYITSLAIPGLALGLAYAMFFRGTPLYNTIFILIIVNVMHFFGSPYMMAISHFKLLNPNLEAVCQTLGGGPVRVLFDVILPNSRRMLLDVFVYFFTNTMVTISAVSLLYSSRLTTLALQITAYSDQGKWESAVAVSLVILVINVVMKAWQTFRLHAGDQRGLTRVEEIEERGHEEEKLVPHTGV
ncbi:MAG: ABC transporter permease subunit [Clostridia bacterium]|nr:ABC transporter permease subunit [Clostridia bacterium]